MKLSYLIELEKRNFRKFIESTNFSTQYKEPILVGMLGTISVYQGQNFCDTENFYLCTKEDNVQGIIKAHGGYGDICTKEDYIQELLNEFN